MGPPQAGSRAAWLMLDLPAPYPVIENFAMSPIAKLIISVVIAIIAYTLSSILFTGSVQLSGGTFDLRLLLAFILATATTTLVVGGNNTDNRRAAGQSAPQDNAAPDSDPAAGDRETGEVKWFNVSKGFGFIIKDDGEEIFVHFRSIRGEGRRSLRDGQRVSFVVTQSDKGPQAEDVIPG